MASVAGALSKVVSLNVQHLATPPATTTNQTLPIPSTLSSTLDTVSGTSGGHDTVGGSYKEAVSGFDTVTGPGNTSFSFKSGTSSGSDNVVATQTGKGTGVTVHFTDGSSLTVAGVTHLHSGFFH
jgi:hypothetical protein